MTKPEKFFEDMTPRQRREYGATYRPMKSGHLMVTRAYAQRAAEGGIHYPADWILPDEYDPAEDADSELSGGTGSPPEEPVTVTPTYGESPEPTLRVIVIDEDGIGEASLDVAGLDSLLRDILGS
jgi:hypothetical protein